MTKPSAQHNLSISPDKAHLSQHLAAYVLPLAAAAIQNKGSFSVAVSGGSLPALLAAGLLQSEPDLSKWTISLADERIVPLSDPDSNYLLVHQQIIAKLPDSCAPTFLSINPTLSPAECAADYAAQLESHTALPLDLALLGLGPDGHTASLFPGHSLLSFKGDRTIVEIPDSPKPPPLRVTMTLDVLNAADHVAFVVGGEGKAGAIRQIFQVDGCGLPGQMVIPTNGNLMWFVDAPAASLLAKEASSL